jgi:multimeric flavodoxin WrbA
MKVLTVLGSPRKKGNTAKILGWVEEDLRAQGHEVDRVNIVDSEVKGCLGCGACQKNPNEPGCVQEDDTLAIFERMMGAEAVVYASPLYCWGFTSQIKALIDRHFCLVTGYGTPDYKSLVEGKRTALLVSCAGPIENNADLIQGVFDRINGYANCSMVGKYVVPFCTTPDAMGAQAGEIADRMARDIGGA